MIPLAVIAGGLLLALALVALRFPVLRRLAAQNARRRRTDALLVVAGCALGAAIITGSLLVGDTLEASLRERAPERLGPVDVVVSTYAVPIANAAREALASDPPEAADGVLGAVSADATLATPSGGNGGEVVPAARLLEVDFGEARDFGGDPAATGIRGPTPGAGEVVLGEDAAAALGVEAGDAVEVYAYNQLRLLTVDRVLPRVGLAGYGTEFEPAAMNAFVAPGTIEELTSGPGVPENTRPPQYLVFVSGAGGVFGGADRTGELLEQVENRLRTLVGYEVEPVKRDLLAAAAEDRAEFAELFLSLGAFAVLAGISLLINILVMLSEERRRELGILRALGLSRRRVALAFALEGALYAVVAAALGVVAGIGFAWLVALLAGGVFSTARPGGLTLKFSVDPASLLAGFLAGAVVALVVVAAAGAWTGRMTVVEAIRDSARTGGRGPRRWTLVAGVLGAIVFLAGAVAAVAAGNGPGGLVLPLLALVCLAVAVTGLVSRRAPGRRGLRRLIAGGAAGVAGVWAVLAFPLLGLDVDDPALFVAQGLTLALAAIVLVGQQQARIGGLLQRLAGGSGLVLRLALAYPLDRRFRTATTLVAYSLIVFTLVFSAVLSGTFSSQARELVADEGGGYDLLVTTRSADPVPAGELASREGVEEAASLNWAVTGFRVGEEGRFRDWPVSGFGREFVEGGPPALEQFDRAEYPDERAVWEAVLEDPSLAVADAAFLESGGGPPEDNVAVGDRIEARSPATGETVERRVVAVSAAGAAFSGVMVSRESLAGLVENPVENRHYLAVSGDAEPAAVAARLEREFLASGLEARSFEEVVREALRSQEQFFDLIEGYLALGLVIGVAGLGVVMSRAARERRYQIGVLRALGLSPPAVRAAFLVEAGLIALEGTLVGAALALATSYQLIVNAAAFGDTGTAFAVPWAELILLLAFVLVASVLFALPAAVRAARMPPATTLRTAEESA